MERIKRDIAVGIFKKLGNKTAAKWDSKRVGRNLRRLPDLIDEDVEYDFTDDESEMVDLVLAALEKNVGTAFIVIGGDVSNDEDVSNDGDDDSDDEDNGDNDDEDNGDNDDEPITEPKPKKKKKAKKTKAKDEGEEDDGDNEPPKKKKKVNKRERSTPLDRKGIAEEEAAKKAEEKAARKDERDAKKNAAAAKPKKKSGPTVYEKTIKMIESQKKEFTIKGIIDKLVDADAMSRGTANSQVRMAVSYAVILERIEKIGAGKYKPL